MSKFINKIPFFIAEISANHCGSINRAKKLIKLAKDSGACSKTSNLYTGYDDVKNRLIIKKGLWKI